MACGRCPLPVRGRLSQKTPTSGAHQPASPTLLRSNVREFARLVPWRTTTYFPSVCLCAPLAVVQYPAAFPKAIPAGGYAPTNIHCCNRAPPASPPPTFTCYLYHARHTSPQLASASCLQTVMSGATITGNAESKALNKGELGASGPWGCPMFRLCE